jgi:acyl-CoA-binding protein
MQEDFAAAAEFVKSWKPSKSVPNEDKLTVYALYKQATIGDVNVVRCARAAPAGRQALLAGTRCTNGARSLAGLAAF